MSAQRGPHVLYVAWGFPPCRGGGVHRALATANAFAERGARVTVLTADRDTFERFTGADTSLERLIHPVTSVHRVPFDWPAVETDIRRWSAFRAFAPKTWRHVRNWLDMISFPEVGYGPWSRVLTHAARRIHTDDPVDLVVASANPNVDFVPGQVLYNAGAVPYVMDYRDAWLLDVFDGHQLHADWSRAARLEEKLVRSAREVWFVNQSIRDWHAERYPAAAHRMHVVMNGYDPGLAPEPRTTSRDPRAPLTFGYIGTVTPKVPLRQFVQGWSHARAESLHLVGARAEIHGYLGFYSMPRPDLLEIVRDGADHGLIYAGPVAKADVRRVYERFDALLLILGSGRYVTSGKVFEYMASALPIVSVHDPGNAASEVLRGYPLWFPAVTLDRADIAAAIHNAAIAARTASPGTRAAARAFSAQYARDIQLAPRVEALLGSLATAEATESVA
jgi:glycosyltransferase involved in cell wall biosynthesis